MSTRDEISRRVAAELLESGANPTVVGPDSTSVQVGADPFEAVIEGEHGVRTRREDLVEVRTFGDAVDFVVGRVAGLHRQRALRNRPGPKP